MFYLDVLSSQIDRIIDFLNTVLHCDLCDSWKPFNSPGCLKRWDEMTALPSMNTSDLSDTDDPQRVSTGSFRAGNNRPLTSWWYEAIWPSCSTAVSEDFSTNELGFSIFICVEMLLSCVLK